MQRPSSVLSQPNFLKFFILSGCGWLVDLSLLLLLTGQFTTLPFFANIISSTVAASMVFLVSRKYIHYGVKNAISRRLLIYIIYTLIVITIASKLIAMIIYLLHTYGYPLAHPPLDVILSKIIVTPPQLISNFYVSRFISTQLYKEDFQ